MLNDEVVAFEIAQLKAWFHVKIKLF